MTADQKEFIASLDSESWNRLKTAVHEREHAEWQEDKDRRDEEVRGRKKCRGCGVFHDFHHEQCPDAPVEHKIFQLEQRYRECVTLRIQIREANSRAVMWHGKYAIVKNENNKLRTKLRNEKSK